MSKPAPSSALCLECSSFISLSSQFLSFPNEKLCSLRGLLTSQSSWLLKEEGRKNLLSLGGGQRRIHRGGASGLQATFPRVEDYLFIGAGDENPGLGFALAKQVLCC
jgi:hypothetical protein